MPPQNVRKPLVNLEVLYFAGFYKKFTNVSILVYFSFDISSVIYDCLIDTCLVFLNFQPT